jgi:hypothetical protein
MNAENDAKWLVGRGLSGNVGSFRELGSVGFTLALYTDPTTSFWVVGFFCPSLVGRGLAGIASDRQALQNANFFTSEGRVFYGIAIEHDLSGSKGNGFAYGEQV